MQRIKEDIRNHRFARCYLLYGEEDYLKNLYKNELKKAVLADSGDINYSRFEGRGISMKDLSEAAQTLPFFSDYRFLLIENSNLFKSQSELADLIKEFPSSTVIVFVEQEIDKRNRLYKAVCSIGTVCEMNGLDEKNLKFWAASLLQKSGKKIRESDLVYLFEKSGTDMELLVHEIEKLASFTEDRSIVTRADIDKICTSQVTSRIFAMIDCLAAGNTASALKLYHDLLSNREKPMSILYLISRHFNLLLQMKEAYAIRLDDKTAAANLGVPPFSVKKYRNQSHNFSEKQLTALLDFCLRLENDVKTGQLNEQLAVELLLTNIHSR